MVTKKGGIIMTFTTLLAFATYFIACVFVTSLTTLLGFKHATDIEHPVIFYLYLVGLISLILSEFALSSTLLRMVVTIG